ncbi:hypothetical protein [Moraxella lacunata]|uniref:hypothetical protein n=1 Tax=Moraxella lacunata TaxID=477 RepID=UPI003EE14A50
MALSYSPRSRYCLARLSVTPVLSRLSTKLSSDGTPAVWAGCFATGDSVATG